MNTTLLTRFKIDLGITNTTGYDSRLESLLDTAKAEIEREGVTLDDTIADDGELIIDYARFLWLSRRGENPETTMPRSLRWRINNRLFGKERSARNKEEDGNV